MSIDISSVKLAALGTLGGAIGIFAAIVLSSLQGLPISYSAASRSALPTRTKQASTSSFTMPGTTTSGSTTPQSSTSDTTTNWAGYVSTGGTYAAVSGSWTVPSVSGGSDTVAADATWIGIGGDTSDDLIQIGTQNAVQAGQVTTGTFYERLPDTSEDVPSVNVNAGDTVTASIRQVATGSWMISITDTTNGESYTNAVAYNSSESSAEWVEEAPSMETGVIPLDDFGTLTFTGGGTTENGSTLSIAGSDARVLTMDNTAGEALTSTSTLTRDGGGFTVSRTSASSDESYGDSDGYGQYYVTVPSGGWTRQEPGRAAWSGDWGQSSSQSGFTFYSY
jgi:hypothetical protein